MRETKVRKAGPKIIFLSPNLLSRLSVSNYLLIKKCIPGPTLEEWYTAVMLLYVKFNSVCLFSILHSIIYRQTKVFSRDMMIRSEQARCPATSWITIHFSSVQRQWCKLFRFVIRKMFLLVLRKYVFFYTKLHHSIVVLFECFVTQWLLN